MKTRIVVVLVVYKKGPHRVPRSSLSP